jgi:hypothetical protein
MSRLHEITEEMQELLQEFKDICKKKMTQNRYELFKYRTLGHIEPVISKENDWLPDMGIDSLEEVADNYDEDLPESITIPIEEIEMTDDLDLLEDRIGNYLDEINENQTESFMFDVTENEIIVSNIEWQT